MNPIHNTLDNLYTALNDPATIYAEGGQWQQESVFRKVLRWIFRLDDSRAHSLIDSFNTALGHLEKAQNQQEMSHDLYFKYRQNAKKLKALYRTNESAKIKESLQTLKRLKNALKDRLNIPCANEVTEVQKEELLNKAKEWKRKKVFKDGVKEFLELDKIKIATAFKYPRLIRMLERSETLQDQFFTWTIRNYCDADVFAVLPRLQEQLKTSLLAPRISRDNGDTLIFEKKNDVYDAQLPFEGKYISVLDEDSAITCLRGIPSIRLKELYKIFKNKNYDVGNVEYFSILKHAGDNEEYNRFGICGSHIHKWGEAVRNEEEYWKHLRPTERHTPEELLKAYPRLNAALEKENKGISDKPWFKILMASRTKEDLTSAGTHGWLKIAIPDGDFYNVYDFGKLAAKFPYWWWEFIPVSFHMVNAAYEYPEQNIQYSHREFTNLPRAVDEVEGRHTMADIFEDWRLAQEGRSKFNLLMLSCAFWATLRWNPPKSGNFSHVNVPHPNPMEIHYLDPISPLSDNLRNAHPYVARGILGFFGFLMGNFIGGFHTEDGRTRFVCQMVDYPYNRSLLPAQLFNFNASASQ